MLFDNVVGGLRLMPSTQLPNQPAAPNRVQPGPERMPFDPGMGPQRIMPGPVSTPVAPGPTTSGRVMTPGDGNPMGGHWGVRGPYA